MKGSVRFGVPPLTWVKLMYPEWTLEQQERHAERLADLLKRGLVPSADAT